LRLEKELVCAPCRHAKMVASSHPPLTDVMTERPCELLHMDLVRDLVLRLRNERHGDAIRAIHSDNGSKFRNSCFKTFCHDLGLEHQFSSPYTPPQNGVVKKGKKSTSPPQPMMVRTHHPQPMKMNFLPPELSKTGPITP
jgi:hypothetical protein